MKCFGIFLFFGAGTSWALVSPKIGDKTDNPQQYVLSHAEFPEEGILQFDCSHCSAMKDLLFIAAKRECGNAGCGYYVFKPIDKSYKYITSVFLNGGGFQFLSTSHHGLNDILFYHHMSAFDGTLRKYEFDGTDYKDVGKGETIKSVDFSHRLKPETVKEIYFSKNLEKLKQ